MRICTCPPSKCTQNRPHTMTRGRANFNQGKRPVSGRFGEIWGAWDTNFSCFSPRPSHH